MALSRKTTRLITTTECPWLESDIPAGAVLYHCLKYDYGCVTPAGAAMTLNPDGDYPFFEIPLDALGLYDSEAS
jgi:hypothetical protein